MKIRLTDIDANPGQPRQHFEGIAELAESIREQGLLSPIMVRPVADGRYQIVHGERRYRACVLAGLAEIEAVVRDLTDDEAFQLAVVENVQREDFTPIEEAQAFKRLADSGKKQDEIGKLVGMSQSQVATKIRFLGLPEKTLELWNDKKISDGHAKQLLRLPSQDDRAEFTEEIMSRDMTVSRLRREVDDRIAQLEAQAEIDRMRSEAQAFDDEIIFDDAKLLQAQGVKNPWTDIWSKECFGSGRLGGVFCLLLYSLELALNGAIDTDKDIKTVAFRGFDDKHTFELKEIYTPSMQRTVAENVNEADMVFLNVDKDFGDVRKYLADARNGQIFILRSGPYEPTLDDSYQDAHVCFWEFIKDRKRNKKRVDNYHNGHAIVGILREQEWLDDDAAREQWLAEMEKKYPGNKSMFVKVHENLLPVFMSRDMKDKWNERFVSVHEMMEATK
jgi:ParB family transcriptional regulator, chromosome partitioning protein